MDLYIAPPRGIKEKESYLAWVTGLGFTPIWLDLRRKVKGPLLLCGGADIGKDLERDQREYIWIKQALEAGHQIIGVCRGMQILNQYFGGKVVDLNEAIVEDHKSANFAENTDHSDKPSQFHIVEDIDGNLMKVNSRHHQHCIDIPTNFKVTHISYPYLTHITEGFKDEDQKIWAVQWHPERIESENNDYPLSVLK